MKLMLISLLALAVPAKDDPPEAKKVVENLQGEWQMARADFGNNPPPQDAKVGQTRLIIKGNKLIIRMDNGGKEETASFTTDLSKTPYAIDIDPENPGGGKRNISVKGIFKVTTDTLQLTLGHPGRDRPADFMANGDTVRSTLVFQRVRPK
jgi:uncharacterized protein (TIGR03067 family)